jgi:hypothetical protein
VRLQDLISFYLARSVSTIVIAKADHAARVSRASCYPNLHDRQLEDADADEADEIMDFVRVASSSRSRHC